MKKYKEEILRFKVEYDLYIIYVIVFDARRFFLIFI